MTAIAVTAFAGRRLWAWLRLDPLGPVPNRGSTTPELAEV